MTLSDSDSDDSFIHAAGLTRKSSQRNKQNAIKRQLEKLDTNLQKTEEKRQRVGAMAKVRVEEDVMEEVKETLEQQRDIGCAQRARELESEVCGVDPDTEDKAKQEAMQTSLSSMLGTRSTIRRNEKAVSDWGTVVKKIKDNKLKKYCRDIEDEILSVVLEASCLATKFEKLPDCLVDWLFETACTCSHLSEGAFLTLKSYWDKIQNSATSLKPLVMRLKQSFLFSQELGENHYRGKHDVVEDVSHFMRLWDLRITNARDRKIDSASIAEVLLLLAHLSLDASFSWQGSKEDRLSGPFHNLISSLFKCKSVQDDEEWIKDICTQILTSDIQPAHKNSEDADDTSGYLARALLVENFVSKELPEQFCTLLIERVLEILLCVPTDGWEDHVRVQLRSREEGEWLSKKRTASFVWRNIVNMYIGLISFDDDDRDFLSDAPKCLAIIWNLRTCMTLVTNKQGFVLDLDVENAGDAMKIYSILEDLASHLLRPLARLSTQPHISRSETLLQLMKNCFVHQRVCAGKAAGKTETLSVQTDIKNHFKTKNVGKNS